MTISSWTAEISPCGWAVYSPPFHSGSVSMSSIIIFRIIRFRPAISTGRLASGISASMKSG